MELHVYIAFIIATSIMIAMPGPSVILTVAHSLSFGFRPALFTVAGETMGIGIQLLITIIGLTSLLHFISETFVWIRWAGAIYLIYLGIRQWKSANEPVQLEKSTISKKNMFLQGLIVTIPNPKSLLFIAAFLPQFIDTSRSLGVQISMIVPTFLLITFSVTSIWALVAGSARGLIRKRRTSIYRTTGVLMILAGMGLAFARKGTQ